MLWPAESIYEGTWASGSPPLEMVDFELMFHMEWSWPDLEKTPLYVKRYTWDLLQARLSAEKEANEREARKHER